MYDIKNMSIWKTEETKEPDLSPLERMDIEDLNLSVRSYNCLRRANCNTVGQIMKLLDEDEHGLRKIRNLGSASETEILEKVQEMRQAYIREHAAGNSRIPILIRPAGKTWNRDISSVPLSRRSLTALYACGIRQVKDLYSTTADNEPGWFAVRELFEKLPD